MRTSLRAPISTKGGFSLVEVIMAMGIASLILIPILGMLPATMSVTARAVEGTEASYLSGLVLEDVLSSTRSFETTALSRRYGLTLDGNQTSSVDLDDAGLPATAANARFKATLQVGPVGGSAPLQSAPALLIVHWPASVPRERAVGEHVVSTLLKTSE